MAAQLHKPLPQLPRGDRRGQLQPMYDPLQGRRGALRAIDHVVHEPGARRDPRVGLHGLQRWQHLLNAMVGMGPPRLPVTGGLVLRGLALAAAGSAWGW